MIETKPLYIETDASGVGLGATPTTNKRQHDLLTEMNLQDNSIHRAIAFASKSLTGAEKRYSNIERAALGILYGLEKFHRYCFAMEVSIITDHQQLITIFKKDVATLSQGLQ